MALLWRLGILAEILLFVNLAEALSISYCSPDNTGSSSESVQSLWQSNGACQDSCKSEYAFAVIQGQSCWCSDYIPDYEVNTMRCNDPCPGYPTEWCGSSSSGLYAYFQLERSPSGTSARSSEEPTSTPESSVSDTLATLLPSVHTFSGSSHTLSVSSSVLASPSASPALTVITIQSTVPSTSEEFTVTVTEQASLSSPSSSDPSTIMETVTSTIDVTPIPPLTTKPTTMATTSSPSPTEHVTLVPSVITVTQNGTTITSTASIIPTPDPALGQSSPPPSGSNPGKTAGIAIGAAVGLAAVLALSFWLFLLKRKRDQSRPETPESGQSESPRGLPRRHASQMSQAGLIDKNPRIITTGLPNGSNANSAGTSLSQSNRYSVGTDLRLNPNAIYTHEESAHSNVSLQDNRDYSRQLQIRNPDS